MDQKAKILPKLETLFEKHRFGDQITVSLTYDELAVLVAAIRTHQYQMTQYQEVMKKVMDRGLADKAKDEADRLGLSDLVRKGDQR